MTGPTRPRRRVLPALALVVAACGGGPGPDPAGLAPADQTYNVRGEVESVLAARGKVTIHHQAIADFVDREGETVGMHPMSMPFDVARGVDLDGLEPGAPVDFTFEVRWENDPRLLVTAIRPLPAGTEIDFAPAPEPMETQPTGPEGVDEPADVSAEEADTTSEPEDDPPSPPDDPT